MTIFHTDGPSVQTEEAMFELRRPGWQARSNCHPDVIPHVWQEFGASPVDLFYPDGPVTPERRAAIASVCGPCPVKLECREHAIASEREGFWGGVGTVVVKRDRRVRGITVKTPEVDERFNKTLGTFIPPSHGTDARYMQHVHAGEKACPLCVEAHRIAHSEKAGQDWAARKAAETPEERQERLDASRVRGAAKRARARRA